MSGHESTKGDAHAIYRELLRALESARSRLAIAMATERKSTSLERTRYYIETDERTRQWVKRLRTMDRSSRTGRASWIQALEMLKKVPAHSTHRSRHGEAQQLCLHLREVLIELEQADGQS